ncbi:MAG: DUF892 family protein [Candidatus Nanohaloarchaea archaeon]
MVRNNYSRGLESIYDLFVHELRSVLFLEQRLEEEMGREPGVHERPDFQRVFQEFKQLRDSTDEEEIVDITALNTAVMIERIEITMYEGLLRLEEDLDVDEEVRKLLKRNKKDEKAALKELRKMSEDSWVKQLRQSLGG